MRVRNLLLGLTTLVAFVPQRGDSRPEPVTHPEWARMMLRGLDLEEALDFIPSAARAFSALSWKQSEWLDGTRAIPGSIQGVDVEPGAPVLFKASAPVGEVSFPVTVVRAGEYRLRVRMAGVPEKPATVDVVPIGDQGASRTCELVPVPEKGWVEAKHPLSLPPGAYRATFALPQGTALETLELSPRCVEPVEPLGGWQRDDVLDAEDLAVTLVRAVDRERELPAADMPIEVDGGEFVSEAAPDRASARLTGGTGGGRATVEVDVPVEGLYSLAAFGVRTRGQRWAADDCRTSVTCPLPSRLPTWSPVMAIRLSKGRHRFTVELGTGDSVERVRLERRKDTGQDYIAALQRMGFDAGQGPVTRDKAREALEWLTRRHRIELGQACWETGSNTLLADALRHRGPRLALAPAGFSAIEPPVTLPCQPPSSPVTPDPCGPAAGTQPAPVN